MAEASSLILGETQDGKEGCMEACFEGRGHQEWAHQMSEAPNLLAHAHC